MSSRPHLRKKFNKNRPPRGKPNMNRSTIEGPQQKLSEKDVGITEYVSDHPGFSGIIKARFSDFHVNEINLNGEVAKLTDMSVPSEFDCDSSEEQTKDFPTEFISEQAWADMRLLLENPDQSAVVTIDVTNRDKEDRTKIHKAVKNAFGQVIISTSKQDGDKKYIEIKKYTKGCRNDSFTKWPKNLGEYLHFLVYKETIDTLEACFKISDCLGMKASLFAYAGVKDKRAKTTQWFSVRKVDPKRILKRTRALCNVHVGNFIVKTEPLKLGQLKGNKFRIALRNVTADDSIITQSMNLLQQAGFINYYGLQRFGNDKEVPTFEIGIKLVQGNWKEACELILKPKSYEDPSFEISKAKRVYKETSNPELASKEFRRNYNKCVESKLLLGFAKNHQRDYVNALENIPRNMRLLYLHSFQSLIWNKMASRRIKEFGLKPIKGDLVLKLEAKVVEESDLLEDEIEDSKSSFPDVKVLQEIDLENYTIFDVVLPLPGFDVKYPENEMKTWYSEVLTSYGLSLEMPKKKVKTYNISGAYRNIMGNVEGLSWKTVRYDHPNDSLIRSDYEELKGEEEPKANPDGKYKALVLEFCLKSSCYATMVLREVLKIDTSTTAHTKMNNYHEERESQPQKKVEFAETSSLLSDADKYEKFKRAIFQDNHEDDSLKRSIDDGNETLEVKKQKVEEENKETGIKMQASLI